MCCFSGPVEDISSTHIFARISGEEQLLVYEMQFSSAEELAMVLPIPVIPRSKETAVRFISLEGYPEFFKDLDRLFPKPPAPEFHLVYEAVAAPAPLEVHEVGAFEASFVPTIAEFRRLDPRFRLPDQVWKDLPGYRDFGFAVFKLAPGKALQAHPMAFAFPTRNPASLFFPTVHIHDGTFHPEAHFDHELYCQSEDSVSGWDESALPVGDTVDVMRARQIVDGERPCFRRRLWGELENADVYATPLQIA